MALQIANVVVVSKIHDLARITGLTKTSAVEKAVDALLNASAKTDGQATDGQAAKMYALLAQFDRIPPAPNLASDIQWDEFGLPK